ncbi:ABC transporter substrate-binding protein [Bacillus sp. C1-1]|nr:ABC transporter substrate-binding protein [Bacillus sp. C1-1]
MKKVIQGSLLALGAGITLTACGNSATEGEVRIAYFPNLTHISTIVALENGYFEEEFGEDARFTTMTVPDGAQFMEAMSANEIDIGTVGPVPAMNTYTRNPSHSIIAGAVNGGAVIMARADSGVESVADLAGRNVAIPTIGSTQDIMLRKELADAGIDADDINFVPQAPADTSILFSQGDADAAATQEPWGSFLADNLDAAFLVDADEFAWGEDSTNTVVTASHEFLEINEDLARGYLRAHADAVEFVANNPDEAAQIFVDHIQRETGNELDYDEIRLSLERLFPTVDVNEQVLQEMAAISEEAGQMASTDIDGLVNLQYLENE